MNKNEYERNGVLFSLKNLWAKAEANPEEFVDRHGRRFLYVYPEALSGIDKHRTYNEIKQALYELQEEGKVAFFPEGRLYYYTFDIPEHLNDLNKWLNKKRPVTLSYTPQYDANGCEIF